MKKFLVLIFVFGISVSAFSLLKGDANNDGVVDVADITAIASYILSSTPPEQWDADNADANSDGQIDVADITSTASIILGEKPVADNTVLINYNGITATVKAASNISSLLAITVNGADVSVVADSTLNKEINYILSGSTTDGMFYLSGDYKCTITLNGVNITNTDSAAIQIENGKRIAVVVADSTENTLVDGKGGQNATFFMTGHGEFEGSGTLNIIGNNKHAYRSDEYTQLKKKFTGTLDISAKAGDGIHVGEYFQMNNGNVVISVTSLASEGIKADSTVIFNGGTINITNTGDGGKGVSSDDDVTINGGNITIVTLGKVYVEGEDETKPQGIKADKNIIINGGTSMVFASPNDGKAYSYDDETTMKFEINGGVVVGVGEKKSEPSGGTQAYNTYTKQKISAGQTYKYESVSFTVPSNYTHSSAKVLVSGNNQ